MVPTAQDWAAVVAFCWFVWAGEKSGLQSKKWPPRPLSWVVWHVEPPVPQHALPAQQLVPQARGVAPEQPHVPFEQLWPAGHAWPQVPQFDASVRVFTQVPEQLVEPEAQQTPFEQVGVAPEQAVVQLPQWLGSVLKFTQPVAPGVNPQLSGNAGFPQAQEPDAQVA